MMQMLSCSHIQTPLIAMSNNEKWKISTLRFVIIFYSTLITLVSVYMLSVKFHYIFHNFTVSGVCTHKHTYTELMDYMAKRAEIAHFMLLLAFSSSSDNRNPAELFTSLLLGKYSHKISIKKFVCVCVPSNHRRSSDKCLASVWKINQ